MWVPPPQTGLLSFGIVMVTHRDWNLAVDAGAIPPRRCKINSDESKCWVFFFTPSLFSPASSPFHSHSRGFKASEMLTLLAPLHRESRLKEALLPAFLFPL